MARTRDLPHPGQGWPEPDRIELAELIEAIHGYAGWGDGQEAGPQGAHCRVAPAT